jgi:hypothetical protein
MQKELAAGPEMVAAFLASYGSPPRSMRLNKLSQEAQDRYQSALEPESRVIMPQTGPAGERTTMKNPKIKNDQPATAQSAAAPLTGNPIQRCPAPAYRHPEYRRQTL